MITRRFSLAGGAVLLVAVTAVSVVHGQIYNWNTGQVIPGTEGITPGPGMELWNWNTDSHNLRYADLSGGLDLHGSRFIGVWLEYALFTDADLTQSTLLVSVTNADFTGAVITETYWPSFEGSGFTAAQLYSTASYHWGDLHGFKARWGDLTGWNLANQNLAGARFEETSLTGTAFSGANLSNASLLSSDLTDADLSAANLTNTRFSNVTLTNANFSGAAVSEADFGREEYHVPGLAAYQLYSTASYQARDLHGIGLRGNDLTGWNLANQNLIGADLAYSTLANADFSQASIAGANLLYATGRGFTAAQLYSTASYQAGDLHGILLWGNNLTGWNLANQNLTDASFMYATLTNVDLSRADTRGASAVDYYGAITDNTILPNGHIAGLDLGVNETLKVRDYDGGIAITIDDGFQMDADSTLAIILGDAAWGSTISLGDGVLADLDGTLALTFAPGTDVNSLLGVTFDLFNWNGGLLPGDTFASVQWPAGFDWDLSDLYLGGHVTLTAVPEPATVLLLSLGALALRGRRQRGMSLRAGHSLMSRNG